MKEKIVLVGGGGHCKSCIDVIQEEDRFDIAGIVESSGFRVPDSGYQDEPAIDTQAGSAGPVIPTEAGSAGPVIPAKAGIPSPNAPTHPPSFSVLGYPVIGTDDDLPQLVRQYPNFLITIGQIQDPKVRIGLFELIGKLGGHFPVIVSPHAYVSRTAMIGAGTIIMHHAVVNAEAIVGFNCILNSGALVEHEAVVGDHCHISTYAILNGRCTVGSRTFIGSRTVMSNNTSIPDDTLVSAGSVVLRSLDLSGTYIGNPLRKIR